MSFLRCALILTIVLLLSLSGSFGYLIYTIVEIQELPPVQIPLTTRIYDAGDNLITLRYVENRIEVPLEQMAGHLIKATIAAEDKRFEQHFGFDLAGVGRAMLNNLQSRQVDQGGSTITQQLAKNLYLSHERTIERKVKEAIYTIHLERTYSKDEILEKYLNTIYYGHAAYGAEAAAQTFFGKNAASLTLAEAALLAGLPRGPFYYSPYINKTAALQRQATVLNQMAAAGLISEAEKEAALGEALLFREPDSEEPAAYFLDHLIVELAAIFNEDLTAVYQGGLQIYTTLDSEMQLLAQEIIAAIPQQRLGPDGKSQPQGALVAIDPVTGYVSAMVGGRNFNETKVNRVFSLRSVGSSFKPFVYAAALENGYTAAHRELCAALELDEPGLPDSPYRPTDFGGGFHNRELTIREALARSCNITAIKTFVAVGREKTVEMAARLGISSDLPTIFSLPLGTVELSLLELTAAYAPFANGGHRVEPVMVRKVVNAAGDVIYEHNPRREKVLDEKIAFLITDMLKDVLAPEGSASQASTILARPAAGKSGTSQYSKNAHMIGYTPNLVAGLYIGDDYEKSLGSTAGWLAAPLWAEFMEKALKSLPPSEFIPPEGIIRVPLCPESGLAAVKYCAEPERWEYFIEGTEPEECRHCHPIPFWLHPILPLLPPWFNDTP